MTAAARIAARPRYGSPAQAAAFLGVSTKTVRWAVASGTLPSYRVGRRELVSFRDADQFVWRALTVPTVRKAESRANAPEPFVPEVDAEELARRNEAATALLDRWEDEGSDFDQREVMEVLREALGARRVASSRNLFP